MLGRDDNDTADPCRQRRPKRPCSRAFLGPRQRIPEPRPARRRRPAADTGRERHHARLGPRGRSPRRRQTRLLRASAVGLEGVGHRRDDDLRANHDHLRGVCGWTLARRTRVQATRSRSGLATSDSTDVFDPRPPRPSPETYANQNERDYTQTQRGRRARDASRPRPASDGNQLGEWIWRSPSHAWCTHLGSRPNVRNAEQGWAR